MSLRLVRVEFSKPARWLQGCGSQFPVQGEVQPVDTWVRWVAARLEIIPSADYGNNRFVKGEIISACLDAAVSPLLFNAGAWLVGSHGARLLIERL